MQKTLLLLATVWLFACNPEHESDSVDVERELNRTVLENMRRDGADLTQPREFDFQISVPSSDAGEEVARAARALGFKTKLSDDESGTTWTVECTRTMVPEELEIWKSEKMLDDLAKPHGGYIDGWGSMVDPKNPNPA